MVSIRILLCCLGLLPCSLVDAAEPLYVGHDEFIVKRVDESQVYQLYTAKSGKWSPYRFAENLTQQPIISSSVVMFRINGPDIRELVAAGPHGSWKTYQLDNPLIGEVLPIVGEQVGAYRLSGQTIAFSGKTNSWDSILSTRPPFILDNIVISHTQDAYSVFSATTGKWATINNVQVSSHIVSNDMVVVRGLDEQCFHLFSRITGKWNSHKLHDGQNPNPIVSEGIVAISLDGNDIKTLSAAGAAGRWSTFKLPISFTGTASPIVSESIACWDLGGIVVGFSGIKGRWDAISTSGSPAVHQNSIIIQEPERVLVFNGKTGRWSPSTP